MRSLCIVMDAPLFDDHLGFPEAVEDLAIEAFGLRQQAHQLRCKPLMPSEYSESSISVTRWIESAYYEHRFGACVHGAALSSLDRSTHAFAERDLRGR